MQTWGSSFVKGGSRYQPYGRTTQQRGGAFNKEGSPGARNVPFGRGTSNGRNYMTSGRGSTTLIESSSRENAALLDSHSWGSRSSDRGFQKRENRQHNEDFLPKRGFSDTLVRSEDHDRGDSMRFGTYQTSPQGFDRNKSFSRNNQSRDYDDVDTYRTTESRSNKNWLEKEPYESLLSRTKVDIDSYRTVSGGNLGGLSSFDKTERYQTPGNPRMMSKQDISLGTYNRLAFNTQTYDDSPRYMKTQDSPVKYYNKETSRNYDKPMDKYNNKGGTFGSSPSKTFDFESADNFSTSSKLTDFRSVLERRSRRADTFSRGDTFRRGDRMDSDDNSYRSDLTSRLDYIIKKNVDEDLIGSRSQIRGVNLVGSGVAFSPNQVGSRIQGRQEGLFTSPSRQNDDYFSRDSKPGLFSEEDIQRKQMGFETRRQDVRSMVREESLFKRQMARQQEREGNKQLLYKKRQDMRGMGRQLPRDIEVAEDRGRPGFKPERREFRAQRSTRGEDMVRSNRRMIPEQNFEQERMSGLSAQQRMMEDRIKQEEMRRLGNLKMEQEVAQKQMIEREAKAMALKNQATIAKQQVQEKTILMQATLMKRQHQIAELMKKRQLLSQNIRNRAQTRLSNSSLVRTVSQRLKDRARMLETQRHRLELRSRLLRNKNERESRLPRERRSSGEKSNRKTNVSTESPKKVSQHCGFCNIDVLVPFRIHVQSALHKNNVKKQENLHAKVAEMIYCDACNFKVKGPLEYHTSLKQHENRVNSIKNGCEKCGVSSFADGKELDKHLSSSEHKKIAVAVKKPKTPEIQKSSKLLCDVCNVGISDRANHKQLASHKAREKAVKAGCAVCKISTFADGKELDKHRASLKHSELCAKEKKDSEIKKKISDHLMQYKSENDIPAYVSGKTFGVEFVVPSQGYACHLCQKNRKFYLSEHSAKVDHCKTEDHYNQWKEHELKLIKECEAKSELTKTTDATSKESSVNEKKNGQLEDEKKSVKSIPEDKTEEKQQKKNDTTDKQTDGEQNTNKTESQSEISNAENKKESETPTSGEEQNADSFKIVDSVGSDADEEKVGTVGDDTKVEEEVKSEELKPAEEKTKSQVSPRGRGRGRVQKARRGRKISKT